MAFDEPQSGGLIDKHFILNIIMLILVIFAVLYAGHLAIKATEQEILRICTEKNQTCIDNCSTNWTECSGDYCFQCAYNASLTKTMP